MYICLSCGYKSLKWLGKCPNCNEWDTFSKEELSDRGYKKVEIKRFDEVKLIKEERLKTGISEFDRVVGGGIMKGSVILIGGDPGVGKSTLALKIASNFKSLYISSEETLNQIISRAKRIGINSKDLYVVSESNLDSVLNSMNDNFDLIVVDSIQTIYSSEIPSLAGTLSQIRTCSYKLLKLAKENSISIIIIAQITKEGEISGPKSLEHIVDVVLYMETNETNLRILRSYKNRFGPTNEIGIFEMTEAGLIEVNKPENYFISDINYAKPSIARSIVLEGLRPLIIEVQSLISKTYYPTPIRNSTGYDIRRLNMILVVIEKYLNIKLRNYDIQLNIVGGIKVFDQSIDLAVALSIISSYKNFPLDPKLVFIGEIGLTGDIYRVYLPEIRKNEARRLGFEVYENKKTLSEIYKDIFEGM
ncbi:MAG: DNA repair protein RadA [candidate division WOR-3 bacterium]|nr:DNA repair protein RadA [candidate division WOR-3 bacterium]MCX7947483.1 DNA repair protein RadA [candidate division WOR-3 bacterium]MDW8150642.1 DNA repair protein RadA [candidate division WOR-3 bacterium]